jgi:imidazolonepropionase
VKVDTIITDIKTLYTSPYNSLVKGDKMNDISVIHNAFIAIKDGKIIDFGNHSFEDYLHEDIVIHSAMNQIVIPGLIDSHTHLVHGGSREHEFDQKLSGVSYMDILKSGGGILSTVAATKKATKKELYDKAIKSLNQMLLFGVTSLEAKSGYGLDLETELKQLEVIRDCNLAHPIEIYPTYLGAHAFPPSFKENPDAFVDQILEDLDKVAKSKLAKYVDVFCEEGVFSLKQTKRILEKAKILGMSIRIHSDEMVSLGGTPLAVDFHAKSVDHLMAIKDKDIAYLAKSDTVANVLPSTSFYLDKAYANGRKLIEEGCALSIASDYNPGSTPSENYQFAMQLGAIKMKLKPYEILTAATINPAYSLEILDKVGTIQKGKQADLVIMNAPNLEYLFYHYGINHTKDVFKNGKCVVYNQVILEEK